VRWRAFAAKRDAVAAERQRLEKIMLRPSVMSADDEKILRGPLQRDARAAELLRRPELTYADITSLSVVGDGDWQQDMAAERIDEVILQLEVQARYAGYIDRQQREIEKHARQESLRLPPDLDYAAVTGLSTEARQRLQVARPETVGTASRLEGVTPAAVSLLLIHLKKRYLKQSA
jgi:tRNA uridine 5-carboxymethylaminomethyl modification enzyme